MIEYVVICTVAIVVSALTLFSGFGLGTLLMPTFALFFPIDVAVAATAVVHLVNNLFKVALVGRHASIRVVIRFALPAAIFAALGAFALGYISEMQPLVRYSVGGRIFEITTVKLVIAALIATFCLLDLLPRFPQDLAFDHRYIPLGGAISGFSGGLSGLQGALRSAFLIRAGLDKDQFIGTGVVSAVVVDVSRLAIYGVTFSQHFTTLGKHGENGLIIAGILCAWLGSFIGVRLLRKITLKTLQLIVGAMLLLLSAALGIGAV